MLTYSKNLDYDIIQIDTGYLRPDLAACYLVIDSGRVAVIDTGVEHTATRVEKVLGEQGLSLDCVDYIVPTHVHLDHAGGAGKLMQLCQNATLVIPLRQPAYDRPVPFDRRCRSGVWGRRIT